MGFSARLGAVANGCKMFAGDVACGVFAAARSGVALLGVGVVVTTLTLGVAPQLRQAGEERLTEWLTARKIAALGVTPEPTAVERATAVNPNELTGEQMRLTQWISRKYRVAPEPVAALVAEAYALGGEQKIDPKLILAVIAIESRFNPFAQSDKGAQGLMQVMTSVHSDKYVHFGGQYAAFDPRSNLRVGVQVLRDYIQRTGSVEVALKWYVGAANLPSDGGYARKVLAEHERLVLAAKGVTDDARRAAVKTASAKGKARVPVRTAAADGGKLS